MKRRDAVKFIAALGALPATAIGKEVGRDDHHEMHHGTTPPTMPPSAGDPEPLKDELAKYPTCKYCGMDRTHWNHSRHLAHYDNDTVDATCSIRCLAVGLSLNLNSGPKAIYGADFGSTEPVKPLIDVDDATYVIGSRLKGTMTRHSKMAFADSEAAATAQGIHGGKLGGFDEALRQAYLDMAEDTVMIRKKRAERMKRSGGHVEP